jgi:iron complex outermembrane receptor protein
MDRRLMLNGALFYIEWDDQIVRALGVNGATLNANAGKTRSQGIELESHLRATDDLTFSFSYAYTDAYFREYVFEALALSFGLEADLAGNELQYVSPHVGTFAIDFDRFLSNGWYLVARTDLSYRSRQFGTTTNHYWVDDSTRVSAMFGFHKDHFEIDVWVKNLFDDDTPTVSISQRDRSSVILPPPGQGVFKTLAFAPDPRAWGVTARVRF